MKRNYAALRGKSCKSYAGGYADECGVDLTPTPEQRQPNSRSAGPWRLQFQCLLDPWTTGGQQLAPNSPAGRSAAIVSDPAVADLLTPKDYPLGTKRLCVDSGYYATFNRANVPLVDIRSDPMRDHAGRADHDRGSL